VVHAGPVHTIHHPDGKAVDDVFWQEREFVEQVSPFTPSNGWTGIEKARKDIQRRLKSLPYQKEIEDVIFRYAVALDQTNLDVAFLQLWSILEKLTDSVGSNYDATINRAVSQFEDPKLASNMLHAIRLQRNRFVHAAQSGTELDQIGYMIKSFVDPHLLKLIQNSFQVDSLEEYGAFLALPTDLGALERQHRRTGRALRMRRSWAKQS
jgi:hypothetical protein